MSVHSPSAPPPGTGAIITPELALRPRRRSDPRMETAALQDLARQMLEYPDAFLPHLVSLAMQVSEAHSAGISLHEPDAPEGDVFRWHFLKGACALFIGRTTPRDSSPCGLCLDEGGPVLIAWPAQFYAQYAMPDIVSYEALLVPIYKGGKEPLGALWVISHTPERRFDGGDAQVLTELATFAGVAIKIIRDARALKEALAMQEMLTREMRHRISNILTVASGLISASARTAKTPQDLALNVRGRLEALGRAQALVQPVAHRDEEAETRDPADRSAEAALAAQLGALVKVIAAPYCDEDKQVVLDVSETPCPGVPSIGQRALTALGLILHELATNAAKYGALSAGSGLVTVSWREDGDDCILTWEESGGPAIAAPPAETGFGSVLIQRTVKGQLEGDITLDWTPKGLRATFRVACRALAR
ncbi:MAG: sensor histidine kinase [Pseudochelatococcus sp.]|jgi:two-component sensor histidine kinase|uniref:sensor histidine kinase n=1 Tax=Pseudochelatococcus sp. TaxID=2020869 RepID=UPI003D8C431E